MFVHQVLVTTAIVAFVASGLLGMSGPGSIILGSSLALSSTAVALQVLHAQPFLSID